MPQLKDFHHYKGNNLSPSEKVERKVAKLLITSKLSDNERESSMIWEFKHSAGCVQIARILAQKRKLDVDIAVVASLIHDIYVIVEGKYKDHARLGAPIAEKVLREVGGFSEKEIKTITEAIANIIKNRTIKGQSLADFYAQATRGVKPTLFGKAQAGKEGELVSSPYLSASVKTPIETGFQAPSGVSIKEAAPPSGVGSNLKTLSSNFMNLGSIQQYSTTLRQKMQPYCLKTETS